MGASGLDRDGKVAEGPTRQKAVRKSCFLAIRKMEVVEKRRVRFGSNSPFWRLEEAGGSEHNIIKKGPVLYRLEKCKLMIRLGLRRFLIFSV